MTVERHCYSQMYLFANGDCSYSSDSFYILQQNQGKCQYENERRKAVFSGCQRMSEERDAKSSKDVAADAKFGTYRSEGEEGVESIELEQQGLRAWTHSQVTFLV